MNKILKWRAYHHDDVAQSHIDVGEGKDFDGGADDEGEDGWHEGRQEEGQEVTTELYYVSLEACGS